MVSGVYGQGNGDIHGSAFLAEQSSFSLSVVSFTRLKENKSYCLTRRNQGAVACMCKAKLFFLFQKHKKKIGQYIIFFVSTQKITVLGMGPKSLSGMVAG